MKHGFCTITVKGSGKGIGDYRGSSHLPRHDQTRTLDKFFRGMSAYGRAISDHVLGCAHCTPASILPHLKPDVAATLQPQRLIRRLIRQDPRTPRMEYARALGGLGDCRAITWAAKFLSEGEFWQFLLGLQDADDHAEAQCGWRRGQVWQAHVEVVSWHVDSEGKRWKNHEWRRGGIHEILAPGTSPRKRELARAAAILQMWDCRIPETTADLEELLPLAKIHGS